MQNDGEIVNIKYIFFRENSIYRIVFNLKQIKFCWTLVMVMKITAIVAQTPTQMVPLQLFTVQRNPMPQAPLPQFPFQQAGIPPQGSISPSQIQMPFNQQRPQILPPYSLQNSFNYYPYSSYMYPHFIHHHQHRIVYG